MIDNIKYVLSLKAVQVEIIDVVRFILGLSNSQVPLHI